MRFIHSMCTRRVGRDPDDFTDVLDAETAASRLGAVGHTMCEYLHDSCVTKLYLDRDHMLETPDPPSEDQIRLLKEELLVHTEEIASALGKHDFVVANRHGLKDGLFKVSYRVFFSGFSVVYHDIPILLESLAQHAYWDTSPYKESEQLLACVNGRKGARDHRLLVPEPEHAGNSLLDFVAQSVDPEWDFLDLKRFREHGAAPEHSASRDAGLSPPPNACFVKNLVRLLSPKRATVRKEWVAVGHALKRIGNGSDAFFEDFREFSLTAEDPAVVSGERTLRKEWDSFRTETASSPLTIKSLELWAKLDSPLEYSKIVSFDFKFDDVSGEITTETGCDLVKAIRTSAPSLPVSDSCHFKKSDKHIKFVCGDLECDIDVDTFVIRAAGKYAGMLCGQNVSINTHLAKVHQRINPGFDNFVFDRQTHEKGTITSVPEGIRLDVHSPFTDSAVARVHVSGERSFNVSGSKAMKNLSDVVLNAIREKVQNEYPGMVQYFKNCTFVFNQFNNEDVDALTDVDACDRFMEWFAANDFSAVKCETVIYFYCPDEGVYKAFAGKDKDDLKDFLIAMFKRCGEDMLLKHATTTSRMKALIDQVRAAIPEKPGFLLEADRSSLGRIAFNNGVYDFETATLLDFSPDIILFSKLPHNFPDTPEKVQALLPLVEEVRDRVVLPIWDGCSEYVLQCSARCAAGRVEDKTFFFGLGNGNSGKGVWMDAIESAFPGYVGTIVNTNLIYTSVASGDQGKLRSWMVAIRHCRFNFSSEMKIEDNLKLDANVLKELSNGGEKLTARQNNKDEIRFMLHGLPWTFANDIPRIQNIELDDALHNRIKFVPMKYRYLVGDQYEKYKHEPNVRRGDEGLKMWIKQPEVGAAFAYLVCNSYISHRPVPPHEVEAETLEWVPEVDQTISPFEDWLEMGVENDFVSSADLSMTAKARGLNVSQTKLGMMIKERFGVKSTVQRVPGKAGGTRGYSNIKIIV